MKRAVIIGAGGYTGAELAAILLRHPHAELVGLFNSGRAGGPVRGFDELFPRFRGEIDLPVLPLDLDAVASLAPDAVFLCTPHEASASLAPALLERALLTLDLSAAFRLPDAALYPKHYAFEHERPDLLGEAVYGLPERTRAAIAGARLIAVPGCYPTGAILPIAPLVDAGAIRPGTRPIIDSTSGVSGAGRTPSERTHLCEVSQQPYGVLNHRHQPEIAAHAGTPVVFTPHLGPFDRGILSTIHVELADGWDRARVGAALDAAYADEPFVRLLPAGQWPSVGAVRGTNYLDLAFAVDTSHAAGAHLILVSAIDNLVKGASGQAVQCMNIRLGLPETAGLLPERLGAGVVL